MHMPKTERTQVLLTPEQRGRVERAAAAHGVSVGALIREAIDAYTVSPGRTRADALKSLVELEAPVDDWEAMKAEILRGASM